MTPRADAPAASARPLRIFISAGEVSGDIVAARVVGAIRRRGAPVTIFGVGGARMREAGVDLHLDATHLGAVGITEGLWTAPAALRAYASIRARVRAERPDVAVLIGNDVFNVVMARWLRRRSITTVSYFPPQVWIWGILARHIAANFDVLLASFPEEHDVYRRAARHTSVVFVGHYLSETLRPATPEARREARARLGLAGGPVVALMPGSRASEVRRIAPVLLDAAARVARREPGLRLLLPVARAVDRRALDAAVARRGLSDRLTFMTDGHEALRAADLALLATGTASLEAALVGVPMVLVYRVSWFTDAVVRACVRLGLMRSRVAGLPNLIAGRPIVPELVQAALTPDAVAREALALLGDERRRAEMSRALADVRAPVTAEACLDHVAGLVLDAARGRVPGRQDARALAAPRDAKAGGCLES